MTITMMEYECWLKRRSQATAARVENGTVVGVYRTRQFAEGEKWHGDVRPSHSHPDQFECDIRHPSEAKRAGIYSGGIIAVYGDENAANREAESRGHCWSKVRTRHVPLRVARYTLDFYLFIDVPTSDTKINELGPLFSRMPANHLEAVSAYAFFIIEDKPDKSGGGGTWPRGVQLNRFQAATDKTMVPPEEVNRIVISTGKAGVIGIPRNRWGVRDVGVGRTPLEYTVIHEAGHAIDYSPGLSLTEGPDGRLTVDDFRGIRPACGGTRVARYSVEAYARFIIRRGRSLAREPGLPNESAIQTNRRIIASLRRTAAFQTLRSNWMP